ncbi:mechanosensitive ion channel family protein [Shimia sp. R10_1]|uniref:mechanosensitive ion channel family protein n=1 Tax=Shimia sp. R10_1 TaxID=2821095 RepID=UPI001AD96C85|nr:mechanosensitive ion channel family protein [Shimia sp. R10_1]MBO9472361.1 mechanosensitive ion channel family protein [Shimia sp. R10_1]
MKQIVSGLFMALLISVMSLSVADAQMLPTTTTTSTATDNADVSLDEMSPEAINAMVARMSDDEVRAVLLDRLDAVAAATTSEEAPRTLIEQATLLWNAFSQPVLDAVRKTPGLFPSQFEAFQNFGTNHGGLGGVLTLIGLTALVLAIGLGVEYIVRTWLIKIRNPEANQGHASLRESIVFLFKRFLREIFGLVIFYITIRIVGRNILDAQQVTFVAPFIGYMIWMPRIAAAFSRFLMAPNRPDLRLVNVSDRWAGFIHRHLIGIVVLGGATIFVVDFNVLNGIPAGETRIGFWIDTMVYVYVGYVVWTAREGFSDMMRGDDPNRTDFDEALGKAYPYFALAVAGCTWVLVSTMIGLGKVQLLLAGAHYATMFWLLIAPVIDTGIRGLVRHLVPPMQGEGKVAEDAYISTKRSYVRIGRVIAVGAVLALIARTWNVSLLDLLQNREGIGDNLFSFAMTAIVGYVVYEGVSLYINRRLAAEMTALGMSQEDADNEMGGGGGSRLSTVLPLLLVTAQGTIIVIFGLLSIGNLGVDITPLLAGAGIAGLAIGFGAQKLVTDVVSGVFFLVDDAFRVGDYVEIDGTMGAVEKISIRSMQLRHHRGPVHTIPYGEIPKLTNYSRDWVIMKLKFTVPFDADPNRIKKIFKKIGAEMLQEELYKDDFLQPFKSQGVFDFDDVGMIIRGKFMAKPGKQFMIRKEIYNRVKAEFKANGIDFARREVRVALPDNVSELPKQDQAAVAAAAAAAAQQQQQEGETPAAKGPD